MVCMAEGDKGLSPGSSKKPTEIKINKGDETTAFFKIALLSCTTSPCQNMAGRQTSSSKIHVAVKF